MQIIPEYKLRNAGREILQQHNRLCSTTKEFVDIDGAVRETLCLQTRFIEILTAAGSVEYFNYDLLKKVVIGTFGRLLNQKIDLALYDVA